MLTNTTFRAIEANIAVLWLNVVAATLSNIAYMSGQDCTNRNCSLYTCENNHGNAVKEGDIFSPKDECNPRLCLGGEASADCWSWEEPRGYKRGEKCTSFDCAKRHPGCEDREGSRHRHGEQFRRGGEEGAEVCFCNNGHADCSEDYYHYDEEDRK